MSIMSFTARTATHSEIHAVNEFNKNHPTTSNMILDESQSTFYNGMGSVLFCASSGGFVYISDLGATYICDSLQEALNQYFGN